MTEGKFRNFPRLPFLTLTVAGINVEQQYTIGEIVVVPEPPEGKRWNTDIIGKPSIPLRASNIYAVADE